jgi:hypothetical protein
LNFLQHKCKHYTFENPSTQPKPLLSIPEKSPEELEKNSNNDHEIKREDGDHQRIKSDSRQ